MKISLLEMDKLINVNSLQRVRSHNLFSNKSMMFDPDGVLSNEIFGISKSDRRSTFAYIDLQRPFIHPHIYSKVLKPMFKGVIYIISGQKRYVIKNGLPVEDNENGWTGINELYKHWNEIDWKLSTSTNDLNKDLLTKLTREQVFINKFPVCPPAYRDVTLSGTIDSSDHINELNTKYGNLIRLVSMLSEGGLFAAKAYGTQKKIQDTLIEIYDYFKGMISKKQGLIRKNLLGKSVDYGTRTVISAPNYNNERFEDNMIGMEYIALPIYQCCSAFYPFIEAWLKNFFTREIINDPNLVTYYDPELKREVTATLKDPEIQFSDQNIKKLINDYCLNPDNRFKIINVTIQLPGKTPSTPITKSASMMLKGKAYLSNNIATALARPMTITDVMYLACVDSCEKRHAMVSRYPVGTDKGIFFARIRVQSTAKHLKVIFNGKEYPYYPVIDFNVPHHKVGVQFVDTLVMSNSHLDGLGADYDGDTVSVRGIWSDEANLECEEIMKRKMSALTITGDNIKAVSKELFNAMYELTRIGNDGRKVKDSEQEMLLGLKYEDISRSLLTDFFAEVVINTEGTANQTKVKKLYFHTWDTMNLPADYFYKGQKADVITVGRFILNKFVLEGSGVISATGVVNGLLNAKGIKALDATIGQLYMEDVIDRDQFNAYTDRRDCLGYWVTGMLVHSISEKMLKPLPEIEKKKAELFKKYEKELAEHNIEVMTKISKELVAYAQELLKDDPGMNLYDSGDLNFGNNYKNNQILKGAVFNKITNQFDFIGSSFADGIEVKDIPAHANGILAAQYPASIATKDAGYLGKKLLALLQMMQIDEPGTDCGTKNPIAVDITDHNKQFMVYSFISNDGQLTELTKENIGQYVGKTVLMRSPMSCLTPKICSKCAGNLFYLLGAIHAGMFATQISHADLNLGLKAKHDTTVDLYFINPDDILQYD